MVHDTMHYVEQLYYIKYLCDNVRQKLKTLVYSTVLYLRNFSAHTTIYKICTV